MPVKGQIVPLAERLERNSIPEPNSGCVLWCGAISGTSGHGRMKIDGRWDGPHRVAFMLKKGAVPAGLDVLHECDVPRIILRRTPIPPIPKSLP